MRLMLKRGQAWRVGFVPTSKVGLMPTVMPAGPPAASASALPAPSSPWASGDGDRGRVVRPANLLWIDVVRCEPNDGLLLLAARQRSRGIVSPAARLAAACAVRLAQELVRRRAFLVASGGQPCRGGGRWCPRTPSVSAFIVPSRASKRAQSRALPVIAGIRLVPDGGRLRSGTRCTMRRRCLTQTDVRRYGARCRLVQHAT